MSRVGQLPVPVPDGVDVQIVGQQVTAKGKLGQLSLDLSDVVEVERQDNQVLVKPRGDSKRARAMWGTSRSLIHNLFVGVSNGFTTNLEINGVGYRAAVEGRDLVLQLGYSHEVRYSAPDGIAFACETQTKIAVSGADRQKVGQVAAEIRAFRKPEPYKGKGIRYQNEFVLRKEGKKK